MEHTASRSASALVADDSAAATSAGAASAACLTTAAASAAAIGDYPFARRQGPAPACISTPDAARQAGGAGRAGSSTLVPVTLCCMVSREVVSDEAPPIMRSEADVTAHSGARRATRIDPKTEHTAVLISDMRMTIVVCFGRVKLICGAIGVIP